MTRALGVSEAEWEALYRRLERPLYNLAYRYVWNSQEAQDILHDAFMALWARRDRLLPSTADRYTWIAVMNLSRKRRRWTRTKHFLRGDDALGSLPAAGAAPESDAARSQEHASLHAAIERLPEKLRAVLLLAEFSEMSYESISELLSIPPGTVASRRNLALKRLRTEFKGEVSP
jgi:RNA polymerase sigma-70 factor (ECF subfamily)